MLVGDILQIPVYAHNLFNSSVTVQLTLQYNQAGIVFNTSKSSITVSSGQSASININAYAINMSQSTYLTISAVATTSQNLDYTDMLTKHSAVVPRGFPRDISAGGFIGTQLYSTKINSSYSQIFTLPSTMEKRSLTFTAKVFSSNFASLLEAI